MKDKVLNLLAIAGALEHAKAKHPKFADFAVIRCTESYAKKQLKTKRVVLSDNAKYENTCGIMVLECEVAEAVEAFSRKDYAATMDELAQCGAVVVRMMEAVQELMDGQEQAAKAGKKEK